LAAWLDAIASKTSESDLLESWNNFRL
jgi:hypothetical protein